MEFFRRASARRLAAVGGLVLGTAGVAIGTGAAVHADPVIGGQLFSGGECDITITVLPATAGLVSELRVYLDDGTLFFDPGVLNTDVGETRTFTGPEAGEELVFAIHVFDAGDNVFKMGPGSRNADGVVHAAVNDNGDGSFDVGFEDLFGGGDLDYDDNVFRFDGCIEPIAAVADSATTNEDTSVDVDVLANDGGVGVEIVAVGTPSNGSAAANASGGVTYTPAPDFCGSDSFTYTIEDDSGSQATATVGITVTCVNDAPVCSAATPSRAALWPPNHRLVPITVNGVTDIDSATTTITITSIEQDERTNKLGDGDTDIDGSGIGTSTARVRAERSGTGDGRIYEIGFTATDSDGASCDGSVFVGVPHDNEGQPAIDSGDRFPSNVPTP